MYASRAQNKDKTHYTTEILKIKRMSLIVAKILPKSRKMIIISFSLSSVGKRRARTYKFTRHLFKTGAEVVLITFGVETAGSNWAPQEGEQRRGSSSWLWAWRLFTSWLMRLGMWWGR